MTILAINKNIYVFYLAQISEQEQDKSKVKKLEAGMTYEMK